MSWTWSDTSTLPIETPWMWPEQGDSTGTKGGCKMSQNKASRATERKREGEREGRGTAGGPRTDSENVEENKTNETDADARCERAMTGEER